jgi:hypothetical protein
MNRILVALAAVGFITVISGCASTPEQSGFLSTYANLQPVDSTTLRYIDTAELAHYSAFIVEPVSVRFYNQDEAANLKPEDVAHLQQFYYAAVTKALTDAGIKLVSDPGPGVARIRLAITNLKSGTPALNIIPQTKLTGLGLGQATSEGEIVDSITTVQIAAAIDSETGSRLSFAGLSKWGDAESVMTGWAEKIAKRIQEAHATPAQ